MRAGKLLTLGLAGILLGLPLFGQGAKLDIKLDHLAAKAEKVVNVNLDGALLETGRQFLSRQKGEDAELKTLLEKLQGVYVRVFEFAQAGAYTPADVESVRKQLSGPGWVSFVEVSDRQGGENVYVYSYMEDGKMAGLAVLAAEPRELTVVNIVGPVDLARLGKIGGLFGIPDMRSVMKPSGNKASPRR
jgi:hypothetical protein